VWHQYPKYVGYGHYGHRLLFDGDGYLWISSGDRPQHLENWLHYLSSAEGYVAKPRRGSHAAT